MIVLVVNTQDAQDETQYDNKLYILIRASLTNLVYIYIYNFYHVPQEMFCPLKSNRKKTLVLIQSKKEKYIIFSLNSLLSW